MRTASSSGLGERAVWSVPLSFGVTTLLAVFVGKYVGLGAACWVLGGLGVVGIGGMVVEVVRGGARAGFLKMQTRKGWVLAGGLLTLCVVGELVDVGWGNQLYMSVTVFDHSVRTSFVDAVVRTGVPPGNPLYWTVGADGVGHAAAMRYYYFWCVVCGLVVKVMGVSARQAMIASCVWAVAGLVAVIGLYGRYFLQPAEGEGKARRRTWITAALLVVTGLDVIPVVVNYLQGMPTDPDMEWWSPGQVTSWLDTVLWVPHHLAALVCCVFGFLLVWMSVAWGWRQKVLCGVLAGVGFAASFGLSTYVAVAFAMVMALWLLWALWWKMGRSRCGVLLVAGLVAVLLLVPYLRELRAAGPNANGKTALFAFSARRMVDPEIISGLPGFKQLRAWSLPAEDELAVLVLLVPGYIAELGFFAAVLGVFLLRMREVDGDGERTAVFLVMNGLLVSTFVRSTVIGTNDFGIRSMLIPQFFLLLLAGLLLDGTMKVSRRSVRVVLEVFLMIGVLGTAYQAVLLRFYLPVEDRLGRQKFAGLAERSMALREVVGVLDARAGKAAVVQYDTQVPGDFFNFAQLVNTPRQIANAFPECDVAFGGDPRPCEGIKAELARLYLEPGGLVAGAQVEGAEEARQACHRLGVDELVATRWDPVWGANDSWVWGLPVLTNTERVRVVNCGTNTW